MMLESLVIVTVLVLHLAVAQGADVVSRTRRPPWIVRRIQGQALSHATYEHLFRGGSDTEEQPPRPLMDSYKTSVCSVQGGRSYMEDEFCVNQNGKFAAVFDGHGGNAVSRYLRQNLYGHIQAAAAPVTSVQDYKNALCAALEKVDREVNRISHWSFQGSTAVAVWIHQEEDSASSSSPPQSLSKRTVIAANVGDSRAVLSRNGVAMDLTKDHKPDLASEKARVEAMGGKVVWCGGVDSHGKPIPEAGIYRVNGNLALSRAIGDRSERPAVTSKPDVFTFELKETDEFIVLGSDGLWDVLSSQEVVDFVQTTLRGAVSDTDDADNEGTDPQEDDTTPLSLVQQKMSDMIVAEALKRGTTDNVTVIVQWLKR